MTHLRVAIVRFVDAAQPGWVECEFRDAAGHLHVVREKGPVVSSELLDAGTPYPRPGYVACTRREALDGSIVVVDTDVPFGIASTAGQTRFEVWASQLEHDATRDEPPGAP